MTYLTKFSDIFASINSYFRNCEIEKLEEELYNSEKWQLEEAQFNKLEQEFNNWLIEQNQV